MELYTSNLRKLIDKQLKEHEENSQLYVPPFTFIVTMDLILQIAIIMEKLHKANSVHQNLKASNVLVLNEEPFYDGTFTVGIPNLETHCIEDTYFWRAPEIIQELENMIHLPIDERKTSLITFEANVYSFGMVCYEIITGKVPYQEQQKMSSHIVIFGNRPKLPMDLNKSMKSLIWRCWDGDPKTRPTFSTIVDELIDLIAEIKGLGGILQKIDVKSSKDMSKLTLDIENFEHELNNLNNHDSKIVEVGNNFIKIIKAYINQYSKLKFACISHPFHHKERALYEEALNLYEESYKICKDFHSVCCIDTNDKEMSCKLFLFFNLSASIAYHLP